MDDLDLKSRLDHALERQLEPLRPEVADILATGRRARRRRTTAMTTLTMAAVTAVVLGTAWLATSGLSRLDSDSVEMASDPSGRPASEPTVATEEAAPIGVALPQSDGEITTACRRATYSSTSANALIFQQRRAELAAKGSNLLRAWALFESVDGTLWGRCEMREGHTEMAVFRTEADLAPPDHYVRTSRVCGAGECLTEARLVAKLPPQVEQVQINFADHYQLLRASHDGWIAMTHLLDARPDQQAVRRVIYFGAGGEAIAEYANTSLAGVEARELPPLTDYPALTDEDRLNFAKGAYTD